MDMVSKNEGESYREAYDRLFAAEKLQKAVYWLHRACRDEDRYLYCPHAAYVGFGRVFRDLCPYCSGKPLPVANGKPVVLGPEVLVPLFSGPEDLAAFKATAQYRGPK